MTVAKVWNGTAWEAIAGGVSQATFDAQTARINALEAQKGAVLDLQRIWCTGGTYRTASFAGTVAYHTIEITATTGAPFMQLTFNSPVPFWWEVVHTNCLIRKDDAAYHYIYGGIQLSPVDQDGTGYILQIFMGHSTVMQYGSIATKRIFKCGAGSYTASAVMGGGSGGTWNYAKSNSTYLEAKAWAQ